MIDMEKIRITVAGVPYTIATDNDPEYAKNIAELADEKIASIMAAGKVNPTQATVLALLDYADDAARARAEIESMKSQLKEYLADAAQAKSERDMLKRELAKLKKGFSEV